MKRQIKNFFTVVAALAWIEQINGNPGWRGQGGPWIDTGDPGGGMQSWGNKYEGGSTAPYGFDQPDGSRCARCTVLQDNPPPESSGPPGPGGGGEEKFPPGYRGNGYDNFSPEWKLREVLQQQGSGAAPLGQVAAGGWKKDRSNSVGMWSGTIRPIEPNWGQSGGSDPPPPSGGNTWGEEIKVSSHSWVGREQSQRKIDDTYRVTSGSGGGAGANWIRGASGWNKGSVSPQGPPSGSYQGGGHGGYHDFDGNRVTGQSLNVQSDFRPWNPSRQPGFSSWDNSGGGPSGNYRQGGQEQAGLQGWGTGQGHERNWDYGRPIDPHPQAPYAPREPDVKNPSNTDPRWGTRGPSWGFRDPPFGSESREPSWTPQNANWNKVSSSSLSVGSGYGPDPPSPQKESTWGSKGYPAQASTWPSRGPPPYQYPSFATKDPSYGGSGRGPGVGCRDLGCASQAGFPRGPPQPSQWGPPSAPQPPSGGGNWGGYRDREPPPPRQPSWRPSGGGGRDPFYEDKRPPPGAPSGYQSGQPQGYPSAGGGYPPPSGPHGGYQHSGPPPGQGYPPQSYPSHGGPPSNSGYQPSGGYNCPPAPQPPSGCPPPIIQGPPGRGPGGPPPDHGYQPSGGPPGRGPGGPPPGHGYQPSGGYNCPPPPQPPSGCPPPVSQAGPGGGPGASGYPPGQGGPGASGYPPGGQGGPGASGYPPSGQGGPGASGYPPGSQQFQEPNRRYNGHSGVGATLDFPGLNAYAHDTNNHGSFTHCSNKTSSAGDQHSHSSTSAPTSTSPP